MRQKAASASAVVKTEFDPKLRPFNLEYFFAYRLKRKITICLFVLKFNSAKKSTISYQTSKFM